MIDPSVTFQTALRAALIGNSALTALVPADSIRAGSTRPDGLPTIILANPQTIHLGRASGGAYVTRCAIDLHIWAIDGGADLARQIGALVATTLWDAPAMPEGLITEYTRPSFTYLRDPDPERAFTHGIGSAEAVIHWSL
ncbi:MAG: DUF3168 domain-containing protein [Roseivivax sp.]|nr:DUF3168 domain-containing protein [Roseivivax sp.]